MSFSLKTKTEYDYLEDNKKTCVNRVAPEGEGSTAFFKRPVYQYLLNAVLLKEGQFLPLWREGWDGGLKMQIYLSYNVVSTA
jgi:hypothetical protein